MLVGTLSFTPLTYALSSYTLIMVGGALGSAAALVLVSGSAYFNVVLFTVLLSLGESLWVPRLLDYTFAVAPEGK